MNRIFLIAIFSAFMSQMAVKSDDRIYETKNICEPYNAVEINGGDAASSLGLKESGSISSRESSTAIFFALSFLFMLFALSAPLHILS
tara:strand:+ start:66 stop:329 length:264 start_codon:yes stop_codon:yes gene_type:complete